MQIMTGIEVNSEAYFPQLREIRLSNNFFLKLAIGLYLIYTNNLTFWPITYAYCKKVWL